MEGIEEIKTAETSDISQDNSHADIVKNEETVNETEFKEASDKLEDAAKPAVEQDNSENARRRREAERQAAIKAAEQAARDKAILDTLDGKNPYTHEEMKDRADIEEYLSMREIERNGGDPLMDYAKFQKQKAREKQAEVEKKSAEQDWYNKDYEDFATKHPEANFNTLIQNEQFQKFASGKVGILPLTQIYEEFVELTSEYEKQAKKHAAQLLANQKASPGALASTNTPEAGFFTKEQVQKMTSEEVHKNYDKIRASMSKWN